MKEYKALVDIENLLKDHVPGKVVKQEIEALTQIGENYGSEILKADFTVENGVGPKVVHAVAKLIPENDIAREIFNVQTTFRSEILWYSRIVPVLQDFQREQGVSFIAEYFPQFYGGRISLNPNSDKVDDGAIILMENLKASGYSNEDRQQGFDLQTTKLILDHLANFHATSVALKLKKPDIFETVIKPCLTGWTDILFEDKLPDVLVEVLKENSNTIDYISRLNKLYRNLKKEISVREPWAGLIHQDFWVNNVMLKYQNHNATKVKMVDFQCYDHGSFARDLVFFLFSSVQTPVQKFHFDKLLRYYYQQYISNLTELKVDTKLFTYKSFEEELAKEPSQIVHAFDMLFVIMAPKGGLHEPPPEPLKDGEKPKRPLMKISRFHKERVLSIVEIAAKKRWI